MKTQVIAVFNMTLNTVLFFVVVVAAIVTISSMKIHFNIGSKLAYLLVSVSLCMRYVLTCYEFASANYERMTWKYYYKWVVELFFMAFYLNCFFKVIASWQVTSTLKKRSDTIKTLSIQEQFQLLYDQQSKQSIQSKIQEANFISTVSLIIFTLLSLGITTLH